ncbi:gypsy retrotransposon integrase-like protein 1 isoform X3 [Melospiza georgiana]|uniref:gypsy retrotransposon integrase-like protein 1 isoform X3 n=1 Tax=Melospiza georgiana TaxID=44398 RepID=UPI0025AC61F6|nr:gypsy retrotransposon integrase-like protein 1 isoform X3 [Melospiza georgiana]
MVRSGKSGGLHLKQIAYYKRTGEYHPTTLSSERSGIRRAAKKFVFNENKLFYVGKDRKQMRLVIVSDEEKKKVLEKCHKSAAGTHHGISRTLTLVECNYYWTSVTNDVKQWINEELFALFGMKQIVLSYPQTHDVNEKISKTIKTFLNKYCIDHPNDWDEHLSAIAYAFNLTNLEPDQNTPYFQMFSRNPRVVEPMNMCVEGEYSSFAKIFEATKKFSQALEEDKTSGCQADKKTPDEPKIRNKITVKRKSKQLNTLQLKVGHEVLRQRKNWWKDGRFQSEWIGPYIIDYITENGCAILRDSTGSRLKRPIKMSHLKPYVRGSGEKGNHYILQGAVVFDHDYIGLSERSNNSSQADSFAEKEINAYKRDIVSAVQIPPAACKDQESADGKLESELREDHCIEPSITKPEQWPSPCWTLQTKTEDT